LDFAETFNTSMESTSSGMMDGIHYSSYSRGVEKFLLLYTHFAHCSELIDNLRRQKGRLAAVLLLHQQPFILRQTNLRDRFRFAGRVVNFRQNGMELPFAFVDRKPGRQLRQKAVFDG